MTTRPLGTVLVTGGAGFIGIALARLLAERAARWVAVDSMHPQVHPRASRPNELIDAAELITGDVSDPMVWDRVLDAVEPDIVIHLAAETGTAQSLSEATRHAQANVVGTTAMTDAFTRHGIVPSKVLLSSSRAVYGEGRWRRGDGTIFDPGQRVHAQFEAAEWDYADAVALPSDFVSTPPSPSSVYGATKLAQEHLLKAWTGAFESELTILRLQNVYGPGQSLTNSYTGIVSLFSQLARAGESIPVYEDGAIIRDFVFIEDVAAAFGAAIDTAAEGAVRGYDVGTGVPTSIWELANEIANFHNAPPPHITGAYREGDVRSASCTVDRTVAQLGWMPQWSLERGIAALQEWIAEQRLR